MPALLPGFLPRGPFDNQRHIWYNTWLPGHAGILLELDRSGAEPLPCFVGHPQNELERRKEKMNQQAKLTRMVITALLTALIVLLGFTPLGLIPLGWCNVTLYVIPVAIGTLLMGTKSGLILGLAFAGVSFASALMKPSVLVASLMASSIPLVIVMTFVPRLCIPLVIRGVYRLMPKKNKHVAYAVSAAAGSLTNTVLYLGMMLLFYVICGIDNTAVLSAIAATAGGAGPCEAVAAALVCPPVLRALEKTKIGKSMNQ